MSLPSFPAANDLPSREQVINQIISSIAMEELGLSHIINAEGEKLQYALGTLQGVTGPEEPLTIEQLLELNTSIHKTLDGTMMNQYLLKEKLLNALSAAVMQGPTGPTGPQGPSTIDVIEEVESLDPGVAPYVTNEGTQIDVLLKFGIPKGDTGPVGTILGSYETLTDFLAQHSTGSAGEIYLVDGALYVWNSANDQWENMGDLQGPQGTGTTIQGTATSKAQLDNDLPNGPAEDAYLIDGELYIWNPTEMWHSVGSLVGPAGPTGPQGPDGAQGIQGVDGIQGPNGEPGQVGTIRGIYETENELRTEQPTGIEDEFYLVGNATDGYSLWIWDILANAGAGDWIDTGPFSGIEGPMGPQGPQGEQGLPGTFTTGQDLFSITSQNASQSVGYQANLALMSDTLSVSVEQGPSVRIEKPYSLSTIVSFSSGNLQAIITSASGARNRVVIIGQGANQSAEFPNDPINISSLPEYAFPMPAPGTINAFSFFFSLFANTGLDENFSTRVTAALYRSTSPPNNDFYIIPETMTTISVPFNAPMGTAYSLLTENINIQVNALDRLMMVVYTTTEPEYTSQTTIGGYLSGAVRFA